MPERPLETVTIEDRAALRRWLRAHHGRADSVWIVTWKRGDPRYLPYADIVEEALCFGWIDSRPRALDAARTMLLLSPRKPGSGWSRANKLRIAKLVRTRRMARPGLEKVAAAKRDGSWSKLDAVDALAVPRDLAAALRSRPPALEHWNAFPPSVRRGILEWIVQAKRPETRRRRVEETARRASRNERANQWSRGTTRQAATRRP